MAAPPIVASGHLSTTDVSWLQAWKSQPRHDDHWKVFFAKYYPYIQRRIGKYFLTTQDTEDLKQEIFSKILAHIHNVERPRKGSFRGWLKQVVHTAICDWFEAAEKRRLIPNCDPGSFGNLAKETSDEIDENHYLDMMRAAIIKVRFDLKPSTWAMFEMTKIHKKSAKETAEFFKVSVLTVYDAVRRVMERLRDIIKEMDEMEG